MLPGCGQSLVGTGRGRTGRRGRLPSFFLNLRDAKRMWRSWSHAHAAGTGKRCQGGVPVFIGGPGAGGDAQGQAGSWSTSGMQGEGI